MNQILITSFDYRKKRKRYKKILKTQFIFSIFFTVFLLFYSAFSIYNKNKKENLSRNLLSSFNISLLYSNTGSNSPYISSNYKATSLSHETTDSNNYTVIGVIEIKKIGLNYTILSKINDDLLKISPCRFYGPEPNQPGNMCIAGHNYNDNRFFSKVPNLKFGDVITITDLQGKSVDYFVFENYETSVNDITCTSQDTNGQKEITLVTCNNITGNRIIIKAKESI